MVKKEESKDYQAISIFIIFLLIIVGGIIYYYMSPFDKDKWCERNKPMLNISAWDNKVAYCYGEGWDKYCKISYPEDCPNNNYSDKERCLRSCETYGLKECPCK